MMLGVIGGCQGAEVPTAYEYKNTSERDIGAGSLLMTRRMRQTLGAKKGTT
jgi:hypothetical protein